MEDWAMSERFLIETVLPIRELSAEARREKAIRHGHISTLHVWWARRPLVTARAAVLGALLTADSEVDARFIANLCRWEVHDGDPGGHYLLEQARCRIRQRFGEQPPKVLDSFAGGGSIPLEALRLGAEAYAVEYNPVAYLILKATVEYPQRYGHRLIGEVKRWGEWVLERAKEALAPFYPQVEGETPIAYLWSRTIRCPNPACGAEIPLFRQFWLARKAKKAVALMPCPDPATKQVDFTIVGQGAPIPPHFDPAKGTVARGNAVCLVCHTSADEKYVKAEAQAGRMGHRLVAVVTTRGRGQGRTYRIAAPHDHAAFHNAEAALQELVGAHSRAPLPSPWAFGLSWIPDEPMLPSIGNNFTVSGEYPYGIRQWGQLFNPRQLLALCTFGKWVREAHRRILQETNDPDFAKAVATYLAFGVDSLANYNCVLSSWRHLVEAMRSVFAGHHLHMVWDYAETNPLQDEAGSGWNAAMDWLTRYLSRESRIPQVGSVHLGSAAALPFPDKHFDAVVIDPPYADNVPYADLADFFYVWLRRVVGDLYPEAFQTLLTPKEEEAVVNPARFGGKKQGEQIAQRHYQRLMQQSFEEIYRVLKPDGMAVVMFTHRSTEAWESLIQSLLDAGLYPTASFPVHTEMEASTHQAGQRRDSKHDSDGVSASPRAGVGRLVCAGAGVAGAGRARAAAGVLEGGHSRGRLFHLGNRTCGGRVRQVPQGNASRRLGDHRRAVAGGDARDRVGVRAGADGLGVAIGRADALLHSLPLGVWGRRALVRRGKQARQERGCGAGHARSATLPCGAHAGCGACAHLRRARAPHAVQKQHPAGGRRRQVRHAARNRPSPSAAPICGGGARRSYSPACWGAGVSSRRSIRSGARRRRCWKWSKRMRAMRCMRRRPRWRNCWAASAA
jgi:adenine-specific DNA methylase